MPCLPPVLPPLRENESFERRHELAKERSYKARGCSREQMPVIIFLSSCSKVTKFSTSSCSSTYEQSLPSNSTLISKKYVLEPKFCEVYSSTGKSQTGMTNEKLKETSNHLYVLVVNVWLLPTGFHTYRRTYIYIYTQKHIYTHTHRVFCHLTAYFKTACERLGNLLGDSATY